MNLIKFVIYTVVGAGMRNTFLTLVGKYLKENWEKVMEYAKGVDIAVLVILVGIVGRFIYRQLRKKNKKKYVS